MGLILNQLNQNLSGVKGTGTSVWKQLLNKVIRQEHGSQTPTRAKVTQVVGKSQISGVQPQSLGISSGVGSGNLDFFFLMASQMVTTPLVWGAQCEDVCSQKC